NQFYETKLWLHLDRTAGGDRHHRDPGRDAPAGVGQCEEPGPTRQLHEQSPSARLGRCTRTITTTGCLPLSSTRTRTPALDRGRVTPCSLEQQRGNLQT